MKTNSSKYYHACCEKNGAKVKRYGQDTSKMWENKKLQDDHKQALQKYPLSKVT